MCRKPRGVVAGARARPIAAGWSLTGAAVQLPQTGRSCLVQRDRRVTVCYAGPSGRSSKQMRDYERLDSCQNSDWEMERHNSTVCRHMRH